MRRKSTIKEKCPIARSLDSVGDWGTLLIVRDAFAGVTRFSDFQRSLGASKNTLSSRLKVLVATGIMSVEAPADGGAHLEYRLTNKGRELRPVLDALSTWGLNHFFEPNEIASIRRAKGKTDEALDRHRVGSRADSRGRGSDR